MKRTFEFQENIENYILKNTNPNKSEEPFMINKEKMEFNSNMFYKYVFSDITEEMNIEIINKTSENNKEAKRIYDIILEITDGVISKMNQNCFYNK